MFYGKLKTFSYKQVGKNIVRKTKSTLRFYKTTCENNIRTKSTINFNLSRQIE